MAGFFKKVFSGGETTAPMGHEGKGSREGRGGHDPDVKAPIQLARFTEFLRYFPPGERVRYYPQHQKDTALETIVLGYGVNNQFIYSPIDIRCQTDGERDALHMTVDGHEVLIREIEKFCFLIPLNRDDDKKRDYEHKAQLGPEGAFRIYNTITLVACSSGGTLSYVDTVVRKIYPLKSGIYAGNEVVMLEVLPKSLHQTDQRQHYRLQTSVPATLTVRDGDLHACIVKDLSEESVRLVFEKNNEELVSLSESHHLTLQMNLGTDSRPKEYLLDGVMYRKTENTLVMKLQGIYKNGSLQSIDLVDVLDLKANLLQHPATQQALEGMGKA
jgi:hypothetical protein